MIGRHHNSGHFETTHVDMVPMVDCIMVQRPSRAGQFLKRSVVQRL